MKEYRFWQLYSDPTPYGTPTFVKVSAECDRDAVMKFCLTHNFRVIELSPDEVWVEDVNRANMQYWVTRYART